MIRTAAVLGAGTMGAQIAAHLANAGLDVTLYDLTEALATDAIGRLPTLQPSPLFTADVAGRIRPASFDDPGVLHHADWVIEAVTESLPIKRSLLSRFEPHLGASAVVSSNTSAIPLRDIASASAAAVRRRWLGTHFFNPPRYQHLVEVVPTADTEPAVLAELATFLDVSLGKGVVIARDTPGFIANRIGLYAAVRALHLWASGEFTMEDIDAATGPAIGGSRSATFRTIDLVGLDVVAAVAADLARRLPGHGYDVPDVVGRMLERRLIGAKAGQGFYRRASDASRTILALDPTTLDYRAAEASTLSLGETGPVGERLRGLLAGSGRASDLVRRTLGATLLYAAEVATEIANSVDDVDRAMRWGFGWQIGPFEMWDAIGMRTVLDALRPAAAPDLIQSALDRGREALRDGPLPPAHAGLRLLTTARQSRGVVRTTPGASLVDLDDGVFCVELHSKMNVIGRDALEMLQTGIEHTSAHGTALVVAAEAEHFSAGADLRQILAASQDSRWAELDALVRGFQAAMTAVKTARVPVIAAPAGLALGGGCELCLHASRIDAAAETYIGLSETSVGLIPAGGGTKEMLLRAAGVAEAPRAIAAAFRTIATAAISTSAPHARALGYLGAGDGITMNRERVTAAAKDAALTSARGYRPRSLVGAIPAGGAALYDTLAREVEDALARGRITAHDAVIGRRLAHVFAGGRLGAVVSEQQLLDLERELFLSLCGEPRTLERIAYTLKTGKPLRN